MCGGQFSFVLIFSSGKRAIWWGTYDLDKIECLVQPSIGQSCRFSLALQIAQSEGLKNIIVEEDSRQCVDALNSGYPLPSGLFTSFC